MDWTETHADFAAEIDELRAHATDLETFVLAVIRKIVERDRLRSEQVAELKSALSTLESALQAAERVRDASEGRVEAHGVPGTDAAAAPIGISTSGDPSLVECQSCGARIPETSARVTDDGLLCGPCFSIRT